MVKKGNKNLNIDQKNLFIRRTAKNQHGAKNQRSEQKVLRRTITIDDENQTNLNRLRGWFLTERSKDLDFTSAVNMLISLGLNRFRGNELSEEEYDIINKYVFGFSQLKTEALSDESWTQWFEYQYPKMIEKLQQLEKKSNRNSVRAKKRADIPEQEQSA